MSIRYVVEWNKYGEIKRYSCDLYETALGYFREKSESYPKVKLYREKTTVQLEVILSKP